MLLWKKFSNVIEILNQLNLSGSKERINQASPLKESLCLPWAQELQTAHTSRVSTCLRHSLPVCLPYRLPTCLASHHNCGSQCLEINALVYYWFCLSGRTLTDTEIPINPWRRCSVSEKISLCCVNLNPWDFGINLLPQHHLAYTDYCNSITRALSLSHLN